MKKFIVAKAKSIIKKTKRKALVLMMSIISYVYSTKNTKASQLDKPKPGGDFSGEKVSDIILSIYTDHALGLLGGVLLFEIIIIGFKMISGGKKYRDVLKEDWVFLVGGALVILFAPGIVGAMFAVSGN